METWPQRRRCCGQCLILVQNNDIFTTSTSWFFCSKCLHLSRSTHVGSCRFLFFLSTVWQKSVEITFCQFDVCYSSAISWKVEKTVYTLLHYLRYTTTVNNPLKPFWSAHLRKTSGFYLLIQWWWKYTFCVIIVRTRALRIQCVAFGWSQPQHEHLPVTGNNDGAEDPNKWNHITQASSIQYDFYSSNSRQLWSTKMFSQLTNKAHFGMPFHGHEKQTCGLLLKPWLSLFPKIVVFPTSRLCSVQFKYYISSDTDSKEYKHNFSNWPRKC